MHGIINLDFRDVCTVLKDGGVAIMSTGFGEGEGRVSKAIEDALHSPLLNNTDIYNSQKILLSVSFCAENAGDRLTMEEMNEVEDFMMKFNRDVETKWGLSTDPSLEKKIKVTILATGFGMRDVPGMKDRYDQEAEERRLQELEREEENQQRRSQFYDNIAGATPVRKTYKVYTFGTDDLDNEEVISLVEMTPTYKRTKEVLNEINAKAQKGIAIEPESAIDPGTIIQF